MYLKHFGLKAQPFQLTPDIGFLFMSEAHTRAKAYMDYTVWNREGRGYPAPDQHPVRCGTELRLCRQPPESHGEVGRGSRERTSMAVLLRARRQASPQDGPKPR